jgi:phosphoserine aminotransferase
MILLNIFIREVDIMSRVYNFSAGPSTLPESVLQKAGAEIMDYKGSGQSVMEMSHRSKWFDDIIKEAEVLMRELYQIPDNYKVLFLQGGASAQFSAIPLNFMNGSGKADYIITGQWAKKAYQEAQKYGDVKAVASSADKTFTYIPKTKPEDFREDADYVYICMNNTIYGTVYKELPPVGDKVLIADVSSCALSEPLDISKFGVVYFGAQKNVAPAGLVVVIVREDLLGNARDITPVMMNYKVQADADSLYNTPPCWTIYICKLVLDWIKEEFGNLEAMKAHNEKKAAILYNFLDNSKMFKGTVVAEDRSLMNVPFVTDSEELNAKFIKEATQAGFVNLKGHRTVGGMRASIYNAMPIEGVEKLVEFMKKFEEENA